MKKNEKINELELQIGSRYNILSIWTKVMRHCNKNQSYWQGQPRIHDILFIRQ